MLLMTSVVLANGNFNWKDLAYNCYHVAHQEYIYDSAASDYGIRNDKDLDKNPGKYFGKNIRDFEHAKQEYNLASKVSECKLYKDDLDQDGWLRVSMYQAFKANILKEIPTKHCKKLAPNMRSCKSLALVEVIEDNEGSWIPKTYMIYGIFNYKGEKYVLPLKKFEKSSAKKNKEDALKYVNRLSSDSKNVKLENDHNVLSLDVDYELNGNQLLLYVSSTNLLGNAKGGISISIPEFSSTKRVISKKSQGFKSVTAYKKGKKLWNREIKKTVRNKYLLLEGWSTKWRTNEEKAIKLVIDVSGLSSLDVHIRSNIIKDKKEYTNPKESIFYNQQGYYDRVETFIFR